MSYLSNLDSILSSEKTLLSIVDLFDNNESLKEKNLDIFNKTKSLISTYEKGSLFNGCYFFLLKDLVTWNFRSFLFLLNNDLLDDKLKNRLLAKSISYHFCHKKYNELNKVTNFILNNENNEEYQDLICKEIIKIRRTKNQEIYTRMIFENTHIIELFRRKHKKILGNILVEFPSLEKEYKKSEVLYKAQNF